MELVVDWTGRASWKCWECNGALAWDVYTQNMYGIPTPLSPESASPLSPESAAPQSPESASPAAVCPRPLSPESASPAAVCSAVARATVLCGPLPGKSTSSPSAMASPASDPRQDALAFLAHASLGSELPPAPLASEAQLGFIVDLCRRTGHKSAMLITPDMTMVAASALIRKLKLVLEGHV